MIAIVGTDDLAKAVAEFLPNSSGFYSSDQPEWQDWHGLPFLGDPSSIPAEAPAVLAIADNRQRQAIAGALRFQWVAAVHPTAYVDPTAELGAGVIILEHAVVQPLCRVGAHSILGAHASIDHDNVLGAFSRVERDAHLAGGVVAGEGVLIGQSSCVIPYKQIGSWAVVEPHAVVIRDLPANMRFGGNPAVAIPERN
jgi:sugar O-acyltransferase (sialic acid O-acetyltransferase NeuD family)